MDRANRDYTIDLLRTGGVFLVILAHVNAPQWLMNLRCFDVVMLVILSGMSYCISSEKNSLSYTCYLWKRIKKLLMPTWGILTLIFGVTFLITHSLKPFGLIKIVQSYLLYDGIGYVWFVRVVLMLALISPMILTISKRCSGKQYGFWITSAIWISAYTLSVCFYNLEILSYWFNLGFYLFVVYLLGYGWIYFIGVHYNRLSNKEKYIMIALCCMVFVVTVFGFNLIPSNDKYPPGANYFAYGILVFCVLYELTKKIKFEMCSTVVLFISRNSFLIYLVHIIPVTFLKYSKTVIADAIKKNYMVEYCFVLVLTMTITVLWANVVKKRMVKWRKEKCLRL